VGFDDLGDERRERLVGPPRLFPDLCSDVVREIDGHLGHAEIVTFQRYLVKVAMASALGSAAATYALAFDAAGDDAVALAAFTLRHRRVRSARRRPPRPG
jgi:hypothetical protein